MTEKLATVGPFEAAAVDAPAFVGKAGNEPREAADGPTLCSVAGCDRPKRARGWCSMHYQRWERHGDPTVYVGHTGRPQVPLRHGTRRMYDLGCRCLPCAVENSRYHHDRDQGRLRRVDADQVRAHLAELVRSGWTRLAIADEAGLSSSTVWYIQAKATAVNRRTADAILALTPLAGKVWLDPQPLLALVASRRLTHADLGDADVAALDRARRTGRISDGLADRIAIRHLGRTLEELYGPGWDEGAA